MVDVADFGVGVVIDLCDSPRQRQQNQAVCSVLAHFKSSRCPLQRSLLYERIEHPHSVATDVTVTSYTLVSESDYTAAQVFRGGAESVGERGRKRRIARQRVLQRRESFFTNSRAA